MKLFSKVWIGIYKTMVFAFIIGLFQLPVETYSSTQNPEIFYSTAVLDFNTRSKKQEGLGKEIAMLLTSYLSENSQLMMVERQEIETLISEQALGMSGTVNATTAAKVGQLSGAKIIISGSIMSLGKEQTLIAKIMGTETSRVFAVNEKVSLIGSISDACMRLAEKINDKIANSGEFLIAKSQTSENFIQEKKEQLVGKDLPTVSVRIAETHVGRHVIDPAGETEVAFILEKLGFKVIDEEKSVEKADVEIVGEALSEMGIKRSEFISCKARVEIKAIDRKSGQILFVDRQTEVAVDTSEQIAGKSAIQLGAENLTKRMIDKIVK